ncbi:PspC domain-containing protein [Corynebacterium cystitidis]|uniref:PspC domain-containing protein n=1 Tax=Corynebacterium cystitidis TaxID=35757 RepID=UPI00211F18F0|nr:PspC domain-containing protein [Corynebacterium cystitidis]
MSTFNDTLATIWATRAPRIPKSQGGNAYFGGVCEGLGARYRIDPTLLRIFFAVTHFAWGGSLLAYLILLLTMPRFGMNKSPWECVSTNKATLTKPEKNDRNTGYVLLTFIIVLSVGLIGGVGAERSSATGILILVVIGAAIYFLHMRTPQPPEGLLARPKPHVEPTTTPDATTTSTQADFSSLSPVEGYPHPDAGRTTPPEWDPLGTAPQLWGIPDYRPPETPQPAPQTKNNHRWAWGLGLLAVVVIFSATVSASSNSISFGARFGDANIKVTSEDQLDTLDINNTVGIITLDLSALPALNDDHEVTVNSRVGEVHVIPPRAARMDITCYARLGTAECSAEPVTDGPTNPSKDIYNPEATGATLTLTVHHGIGNVTVDTTNLLPLDGSGGLRSDV